MWPRRRHSTGRSRLRRGGGLNEEKGRGFSFHHHHCRLRGATGGAIGPSSNVQGCSAAAAPARAARGREAEGGAEGGAAVTVLDRGRRLDDDSGVERRAGAALQRRRTLSRARFDRDVAAQRSCRSKNSITACATLRATLGFLALERARPELQLLSTLGRWTKVQWRHPWLPRKPTNDDDGN